ncbi:hypothetical protein ACROYT_G039422 [Oculina patagonica]
MKETAVEIGKSSCSVVLAYHESRKENDSKDGSCSTAHQAEFSLLLSALAQRFSDNTTVSSLLADCIGRNPGVILMSHDSAVN